MLAIRGMGVSYLKEIEILEDIDLVVERHTAVVVAGAAGSGKTTLLAVASGIIPMLIRPRKMRGRVEFEGEDISRVATSDLYKRVGVLLQSAEDQIWDLSVEDLIALPLENRGVPRPEIRSRVRAVMEDLGIVRLLGSMIRTLSGGERRIALLASVLVWRPSFLVLDEPMGGLDPAARMRIAAILLKLRQSGLTLLIAEQDIGWLEGIADRVLFLKAGRVVANLTWSDAIAATETFEAVGIEAPHTSAAKIGRSQRRCHSAPGFEVFAAHSLIRNGSAQPILQSVDMTVAKGEVAALIGPNGAGKTTFVRSILGLQQLASGKVEVAGKDVAKWTIAQRAGQIGYVTQNPCRMFFLLSAFDEVIFSLSAGGTGARARKAYRDGAMELLCRAGLAGREEDSPFALSSREQLMLALACVEARNPSVIILDEPQIARDRDCRSEFFAFLARCRARACAVLLVSHDLALVDIGTDSVHILDNGRIAFAGTPDQAWDSEAFAKLGWAPPERSFTPLNEMGHALA